MNPVNGRKGEYYNGEGVCEQEVVCRTNPQKVVRNRVKFQVFVIEGNIKAARWSVFGDPVVSAAASWCVKNIVGKDIDETIHLITPERMALDLGITDELDIRAGCQAAIESIASALNDYKKNQED